MGVHIQAWHYRGQRQVQDDPWGPPTVPQLEEVDSWDSFRYEGDSAIPEAVEYTWAPWSNQPIYYRPAALPELRCWVESNVPQVNQERWFRLLDLMQADESIWLEFST